MNHCRTLCPHCNKQLKCSDKLHPHNGYYLVTCHCKPKEDARTYYQAFYHWKTKELIGESIAFPEFLIDNNVLPYPKETLLLPRTLRVQGAQISGWRWVQVKDISYWTHDPILTMIEPLKLNLDQLEPLKDLIRSLIIFS